jgi:uncharacterized protein (UPF0332 family)
MRPETAQFFENARDMLVRGRRMLEVDLYEDAGRAAYLAAFHAAQAFIFEREYRVLKTHGGVQSEFAKLIKDNQSVPAELRGFVSRAYAFKTIADYDPHTSVPPTTDDARSAIETATRFVDEVARLTALPYPTREAPDHPAPR